MTLLITKTLHKLKSKTLLTLLLLTITTSLAFCQEVEPIWGNWYRADTYLPIRLTKNSDESLYHLKNKYTEDTIKFTNDRPVESLLKVAHDATVVEVVAGQNLPQVFPLNIQILQTTKALIAVAGRHKEELANENAYVCISVADLPELETSYQMVNVLLLTKEFPLTLNNSQVEAIRNWVFLGGVLYFDQQSTMLQHSTLTVEILKPLIKKDLPRFGQLPEEERKKVFHEYAQKVFSNNTTTHVLNGKVGLYQGEIQNFAENSIKQDSEAIKWHLRDNQNNYKKKSKIKAKIENDQTAFLGNFFTIVFFCMLGATLIKFKFSFAICSAVASLSVIPIIYNTPVLKLDGHLDKLILLSETLNYQTKKESLSLVKKKDQSLLINFEKTNPFFCFETCKIVFHRNNQNRYQSMEIKISSQEVALHRSSFDDSFYATSRTQNDKPEIYTSHTPDQIFLVQENKMTEMNFETSKNKDLTKINTTTPSNILERDTFNQELWYPTTNRKFYSEPTQTNSMFLIKGKTNKITYTITPPLNIQETEYNLLLPHN